MPRYRIHWNIGYGMTDEIVEADDLAEAIDVAYEAAREDFENNAEYGADLIEDEDSETDD